MTAEFRAAAASPIASGGVRVTARRAATAEPGDVGVQTAAGELCLADAGRLVELDYTDLYDGDRERHIAGVLHRMEAVNDGRPLMIWVKGDADGWAVHEPVELAPSHPVTLGPPEGAS